MKKTVEAEGSELVLRNTAGDHVIIPKDKRDKVNKLIKAKKFKEIDKIVESLPTAPQYAQDGGLYPDPPEYSEADRASLQNYYNQTLIPHYQNLGNDAHSSAQMADKYLQSSYPSAYSTLFPKKIESPTGYLPPDPLSMGNALLAEGWEAAHGREHSWLSPLYGQSDYYEGGQRSMSEVTGTSGVGGFALDMLDPSMALGVPAIAKATTKGVKATTEGVKKGMNKIGNKIKERREFNKLLDSEPELRNSYVNTQYLTEPRINEHIEEGNKWLQDWIEHPETQKKIQRDFAERTKEHDDYWYPANNSPDSPIEQGAFMDDIYGGRNLLEQELLESYGQAMRYEPDVKLYRWQDMMEDIIDGSEFISGNRLKGVSTTHHVNPSKRAEVRLGVNENPSSYGLDKSRHYGEFVNPAYAHDKSNIVSTTIHEGTHGWVPRSTLQHSGQARSSRNFTMEPNNNPHNATADMDYYSDPTEVHARLMELRHHYKLKPGESITDEKAEKILKEISSGKTPINWPFAHVFTRPQDLVYLLNRMWAPTAGVTVGGTALSNQNSKE